MSIRLGIAPIGWSNDDLPQLGGEITLAQCLAEAKLAGYSGVEKGGKFPMDPAVLGPILKRYELDLASGWFSGELRHGSIENEKQRIREQLDLYLALEVPVMVYAETTDTVQNRIEVPVADRPTMTEEEIKAYGEKLTTFAEWLKAEGCPLTYHHHMGTVIEKEHEVDTLMANTGEAVGLLLDTGHLTFAGGNVDATTRRHGPRINHVHVKDIRGPVLRQLREGNWSFLKGVLNGVFTVPGDGMIDFASFAHTLKEIGYSGWVVVEAEQDPAVANPLDMARIGMNELRRVAADASIEISD
jgi:inosose dehydratase